MKYISHGHQQCLLEGGAAIENIRVDPKEISKIELRLLCAAFLDAAMKFYEDPANIVGYETWLAERKGGTAHGQKDGGEAAAGLPDASAG